MQRPGAPARSRALRLLFSCLVSAAATAPAAAQCELYRIESPDPAPMARFGYALDVSGGFAAVGWAESDVLGTNAGVAWVFNRTPAGWVEVAELYASNATDWIRFGGAVAIDGETLIVARRTEGDANPSWVYVFERTPSGWVETQRLEASDPEGYQNFGWSLAIDGDVIVVGAPQDDVAGQQNAGSVYVFERGPGGWFETAKSTAIVPLPGDHFGGAVAVSGDTILVGAPHDDGAAYVGGMVYFIERSGGSWGTPVQVSGGMGATFERFGIDVAIEGDLAVIGSDLEIGGFVGRAYVYERSPTGWTEVAELEPSDGEPVDRFGLSVDLDDGRAIVGSFRDQDGGPRTGSAYVFQGTPEGWVQRAKLVASDPAIGDELGLTLALSGPNALIGAEGHDGLFNGAGLVYAYDVALDYCDATANSQGTVARLGFAGRADVTSTDFTLRAEFLPPNQAGAFFYGATPASVPFASGVLCVGFPLFRLPVVPSSLVGVAEHTVDFGSPASAAAQITAGTTRFFQYWYRDPLAGGFAQNLSDAREVTFCP